MKIPKEVSLWAQTYRKLNYNRRYDYLLETFKGRLSGDFLKQVDVIDYLMNYFNKLDRQKEHDKILKLIDLIYKYNEDSFKKGDYQYIDSYILDIKLFKNEISLKDFSNLIVTPVDSIDKLIEYLEKLVYYGYDELAYNIALEVYTPIVESSDLISGTESNFGLVVFLYKWQQHYEKITEGEDLEREEFISFLEEYGYPMGKYYDDIYNYLTGKDNFSENCNQEFLEDQRTFIIKINWLFLKYMYENKDFNFQISDSIWQQTLSYLQKNKNLEELSSPNELFMIDRGDFRKYLTGMDSFLSSKDNNIFLLLWGIVYLYNFLYNKGIISKLIYKSAQKIFAWTKEEVISDYSSRLWKYNFVHSWPKPDNIAQDIFEKEENIFIDSFDSEIENKYSIEPENQSAQQVKKSLKVGRNDPCPCGSGRKYKKCCLRKMERQEGKWKNNQEVRSLCWLIDEIEEMETEEIIDKLFYFGVYFNPDVFKEKLQNCSVEEIVMEWYDSFSIRARYFNHDFIKLAAEVMKKRIGN